MVLKKDGSQYLVYFSGYDHPFPGWDVIHWGIPVAMSDPLQAPGWCNRLGFKLKGIQTQTAIPLA